MEDWTFVELEDETTLPPIGKEVLCCIERDGMDERYAWLWTRVWSDEDSGIWHWSDMEFCIEDDEKVVAWMPYELPKVGEK